MPFRICGTFEVAAESRPENGDDWGLLLRWQDRDGTAHEWIMPRRLLAGEGVAVRERLAACGLFVSAAQGARLALVQFLATARATARVRTVPRTGWYRPASGSPVFVLPSGTIGASSGELVRLDMDPPPSIYGRRGTVEGWRDQVARLGIDNTRLAFGVSCGFAGPLLFLAGDEGGGINLRGESSKGKTTIIDAAAWAAAHVPKGADGQVQRAGRRMALVAVAGELATEAGITGWPIGEAERATAAVFRDWMLERGGIGSREDHNLFAALRRFIGMHGAARFAVVKDPDPEADGAQSEPPLPDGERTINRAGWRWQKTNDSSERRWVHGMLPEVFAAEIIGPLGLEEREARTRLGKAGLIRG